MKEINFEGEIVKVLMASGYNDGWYWDMNAIIEYKGETYSLFDAGSGSGYILCCGGITKKPFDRLYGEEQGEIEENEWDYFEESIKNLLSKFEKYRAKESYEYSDDEDFTKHILVDGEEIED